MSTDGKNTPTRGVRIMTLDRERYLRYSFATRKKMLADLGGEERFKQLAGDDLPLVLWYGLRHEDPELTVEQVEELIDLEHLNETVEVMLKALGYKGKLEFREEAGAATAPSPDGPAEAASST